MAYACAARVCAMVAVLAPCATLGCAAGGEPRGPREAIEQYALALREQRIEDAYALLSREARAQLPFPEFSRMVAENAREIEEISTGLLQPGEAPQLTATLTTSDGETLLLVYEGDRWRIDASALDVYGQDTPLAALKSFVRAFRNRRYDLLMRFVPEAKREGLDAEKLRQAWEGEQKAQLEQLTQALEAALPNVHVETIGSRATVTYGAGGTVELVYEQGVWRIEDF